MQHINKRTPFVAVPEPPLEAVFDQRPRAIFICDPRLPLTEEQQEVRARYEAFAQAPPPAVVWQTPAWQVAMFRAARRLPALKALVL